MATGGFYTHIRESLATTNVLALMGLLPSMCANMDGQGASLDKAFSTSRNGASIRPLVSVYTIMSLQIRLSIEALC